MKAPLPTTASLACLALSTIAAAQAGPGQRIATTGEPVFARLDLDTGVTEMLSAQSSSRANRLCFDNSIDDEPFRDALLFPANDELFDWGVKACGGSSFVDTIEIGYSSMADPTVGGALKLRVYERAFGFGTPGRLVTELDLSGLPSTPSGQATAPVYLEVDLGSQAFFLPDGPIGWSYENQDGMSAPLLVDVDPSTGTANFYDFYRPGPAVAANFVGTFVLGPGGASNDPKENSFHIRLFQNEEKGTVAAMPAPPNPGIFAAPAPTVGAPWPAQFDLSAHPWANLSIVALTSQSITQMPTTFGTLLLDLNTTIAPISVQPGFLHVFNIPLRTSNVGIQFFAQGAIHGGATTQLTNGLSLTIGAF